MSLIKRINTDIFTIISVIGMDALFKFNGDRAMRRINCKLIIKGSTNLKFITPPHLLTSPEYFKSHEKLRANDLDVLMVMDNSFDETMATEQVNYFKSIISNSWNITRNRTHVGYAILQIENILSQYGYTIVIDDNIGVTHTLNDILNNPELMPFYTENIINRKQKLIPSANKRLDILFIKIKDKITNHSQELDLVEITFLINKTKPEDVIPSLYYASDELVTPVYFMSDEWKHTHPASKYSDFLYALNNQPVNTRENAAFLSIAYILHELHRLYNYSFGPYTRNQYYWKRAQVIVRLEYVLKLIRNNQISKLFLDYDNTFKDKPYFKDLLIYLKNGFYDEVSKPSGDPFYDFETNKPIVTPGLIASASYELTVDNAKVRINSSVPIELELVQNVAKLMEFNNPKSKVGKFMLDYLIDNKFTNEVLSYTSDSSNYASGMFGWIYTGSDEFLNTKVNYPSGVTTAVKLHQKFVQLYSRLDLQPIHKEFPQTYMLYKGVNMLNCRSSNKSYLKFDNLDLSRNNYIFNSTLTSATSAIHVSSRFVNSECCLLRIKMKRKHKVLIIPDDSRVSSVQKEYEFILPPNSVFKITKVQYVYHKQLVKDSDKPNSLVLVIDCDYMHDNDGDKIAGLELPLYQIPLDDPDEPYSLNEMRNSARRNTSAKPGSHKSYGKLGSKSTLLKKLLTGGRIPMSSMKKDKYTVTLTKYNNKTHNHINSNKLDKVSTITYHVVLLNNNILNDTCCNDKVNDVGLLTDAAYDIIQKAYAHPDAPNNMPMTWDTAARCVSINKEHDKYMAVITDFVSSHPEYSYILDETSFSKITDTYDSVTELDYALARQRIGKANSMPLSKRSSKQKQQKSKKSHDTEHNMQYPQLKTLGSRYTKKNMRTPSMNPQLITAY